MSNKANQHGLRLLRHKLSKASTILFSGLLLSVSLFSGCCQAEAFEWNREELFKALELNYVEVKSTPAQLITAQVQQLLSEGEQLLKPISEQKDQPPASRLLELEQLQFRLAALAAAQPTFLTQVQRFVNDARAIVLRSARHWQVNEETTHQLIYRVIYGGRVAIYEAIMQQQENMIPETYQYELPMMGTPHFMVEGVRVHSGDIVLTRGGAPTSTLIARGNDYPASFSHVAMVHIDAIENKPVIIESLIQKGLVITSMEEFLEAKKHRILLLRIRPDHPQLTNNPMLPHEVAETMLSRARDNKIGYDFEMNWADEKQFFCSEVPYHAYKQYGLELWQYRTRITEKGTRQWLSDLGVSNFQTLAPSDLQYDPNLVVVAEWLNSKTLYDERLDNAILDALLDDAETGTRLRYQWYKLPLAQVLKLFTPFSKKPMIPPGMPASTALRVRSLIEHIHPYLKDILLTKANSYRDREGYNPPYWELTKMAQQALLENKSELAASLR